jgi:hypothetical protein
MLLLMKMLMMTVREGNGTRKSIKAPVSQTSSVTVSEDVTENRKTTSKQEYGKPQINT